MSILTEKLKKYQRHTVQKVCRKYKGRTLLALDMGLGKTVIALSIIQQYQEKALIICPASLKYNWVAEIEKFWPDMSPYVCSGQKPPAYLLPDQDIFICNYEILQFWKNYFIKNEVKILVADESHFLKEKNAKRTKAALYLSDYCRRKILMTGTPIENKPIELWSQLAIINKKFFPSWLLFAKRFNGAIKDTYGWKMTRATNTKELNKFLVENCMIRLKKEAVLKELPPIVRQIFPVEIDNLKEYRDAEEDIIAWIMKNNRTGLNIEKTKKAEAMVRFDKLKLIAAKGKMKQAVEWINEASQNQKIVVFCYHREILEELHKQQKNVVFVSQGVNGEERQKAVEKFQRDEKARIFQTTVKIGGTGFTLTASNTTVFLQFAWTPSAHNQAECRVHRIGQEADSVNAIYFVAKNTVEERIMKLLDTKLKDSTAVIDGKEAEEDNLLTEILKGVGNKQ